MGGNGLDCLFLILILSSIVGVGAAQENYAIDHRRLHGSIAVEMNTVLKKIGCLLVREVDLTIGRDRVLFCTCTG